MKRVCCILPTFMLLAGTFCACGRTSSVEKVQKLYTRNVFNDRRVYIEVPAYSVYPEVRDGGYAIFNSSSSFAEMESMVR